jgi:hypothetical protein
VKTKPDNTTEHVSAIGMKNHRLVAIGHLACIALAAFSAMAGSGELQVYPPVPGLAPSDHYAVRVRAVTKDADWQSVFPWMTRCGTNSITDGYFSSLAGWTHTYVNFAARVPVVVELSKVDGGIITNAAVHPAREGSVVILGGKAYVTLSNCCNVAVDINGQMDEHDTGFVVSGSRGHAYQGPPIHTLSIHNNPPFQNVPATNDPTVYLVSPGSTPPSTGNWTTLYFLPGIHNIGIGFRATHSFAVPFTTTRSGATGMTSVSSDTARCRKRGGQIRRERESPRPITAGIVR